MFRSDEFSCVGIAGMAGIGVELVRLFQVELEHYEKIEGRMLSLEGKANRLATMVRGNLGAAMQGLVVVPLFAGFDEERGLGRIFSYDVAGGRYEEHRFHSIGSGSVFARGALKKLYRDGMSRRRHGDGAACRPSTTRPTTTRPPAARTSAGGSTRWWPRSPRTATERLPDAEAGVRRSAVVERADAAARRPPRHAGGQPPGHRLRPTSAPARRSPSPTHSSKEVPAVSMPFYVSPEQPMKDKADYARKGIARGRSGVVLDYDAGFLFVSPNPSRALHKFSEIYDRIAFAAVGRYNEFERLRQAGSGTPT